MNERIEELMSIICEGQNSIQREEVENYINHLQSKIDKAIEYIEDNKRYAELEDYCKNGNDYVDADGVLDILKN